jgi:hypothetical protein
LSPLDLYEVVDITLSGPDHPLTVKARVVWSNATWCGCRVYQYF